MTLAVWAERKDDQTAAKLAMAAMTSETVTVRMIADTEPPSDGEAPPRGS